MNKPIKGQLLTSVRLEQVLNICEQNKQFLVAAEAAIALHRIAKFSKRQVSSGTIQMIRDLEINIVADVQGCQPIDVANIFWAFGRLKIKPGTVLVHATLQR
jgi:hypothetical protein